MYKEELIYLVSTADASVLADGTIPLTVIKRRRGCACQNGNNSVIIGKTGYYKITASVSFTAPVAGNVSIALAKNGVAIDGTTSTVTVGTASTEYHTLTATSIERVFCCEGSPTISLLNTGVAITAVDATMIVEYLG